jgi:hypothetical protein
MGVGCGASTADTTQKKTGMRLRPQVGGEFAKRERNGKKVVKSCGHWFSLMGTFLPFEIITYAI